MLTPREEQQGKEATNAASVPFLNFADHLTRPSSFTEERDGLRGRAEETAFPVLVKDLNSYSVDPAGSAGKGQVPSLLLLSRGSFKRMDRFLNRGLHLKVKG